MGHWHGGHSRSPWTGQYKIPTIGTTIYWANQHQAQSLRLVVVGAPVVISILLFMALYFQ